MSDSCPPGTLHGGSRTTARVVCLIVAGLVIGSAAVQMLSLGVARIPVGESSMHVPIASAKADSPDSFAASAQESIARREYEATETDRGLQAPNRAHNLRTYFEPWGVRVEDRTAEGGPELFRMKTVALGRKGQTEAMERGEIRTAGSRVENRRGGGIVEWYENGVDGLEHGYVIDSRPAGDGVLRIDLTFEGAKVSFEGDNASIESANGRLLHYSKLEVDDATGREVPARMDVLDPQTVRLTIEDNGVAYPIVVDPLLTSIPDSTVQTTQTGSQLGISVAGAGDVNGDGYADVIVGARQYDLGQMDEGAAFVFHGSPSGITGTSPSDANATLQSNFMTAYFGWSVAGAGDVNGDGYSDVIVGAPFFAGGAVGRVFLYLGSPTGINGTAASAVLDGPGGRFGWSVASAGDVNGDGYSDVIVGANVASMGGMALVYHGGPLGLIDDADATLSSDQTSGEFGYSVAGAGDVNGDGYSDVIVGAKTYSAGQSQEGAAFIFQGSSSGVADGNPMTALAVLQSNQVEANLGDSVAGAGDVNGDGLSDVIVGALNYDSAQLDAGAAFVFHGRVSASWTGNPSTADATIASEQSGATLLGDSVAGAGDVNGDGFADVIVGSSRYSLGELREGAAFVFHGGPLGIQNVTPTQAKASLQVNRAEAAMGTSVAGAGDVNADGYADVISGAPSPFLFDPGIIQAACVYHGGASGVRSGNVSTANATVESNQDSALLGLSVAGAGDVNGDGYSDVIIGSLYYDNGQSDEGAAFVFHGGPSGIVGGGPPDADSTIESNQASAYLGYAVSGAGDVNGDGYADVVVGAPNYDSGQLQEGVAFVFHGGPGGIGNGNPITANATLESDQANAFLGIGVAGAGDVNGDGFGDVVIGSESYSNGQKSEGAAFIFQGGPVGIESGSVVNADTTLESDQGASHFGFSLASAGDVNGDGYSDVIVGARAYANGQVNEGTAFIFHGGASGIVSGTPGSADALLESDQSNSFFGWSVSGAGDVNGDGYADVIVGAFQYSLGELNEGAAFVFHGGVNGTGDGSPADADATLQSNLPGAALGWCVSTAGDLNGDGFADVVVGVPQFDVGVDNEGRALLFHGSPLGVANGNSNSANAFVETNQIGARFGDSVAGAGDVNGDGFADIIVGARGYDSGTMDEGGAFVFHGNGGIAGRSVLARQLRGNDGTVGVEPWGSSTDSDGFRVQMTATHPLGRGRVKLQVQATPVGENWGGPNNVVATSTSWAVVPATSIGAVLAESVTGLDSSTLYRWRARVLYAPVSFVNLPATPSHGPWRRVGAQAVEADIRTANECAISCPANITTNAEVGSCSAVVAFMPMSTGDCGGMTCTPPSSSAFPVGTTMVTCSKPGGTSCSFSVTVNDTQAPMVNCPAAITVGNSPGQCSAVVSFAPTASDNCPGSTVLCVPASGSTFPLGTTMVTCTATDASGNNGNCSFSVTVNDTQAPGIACPASVQTTALTSAGRIVSYAVPTSTDNCGATVACLPASGSTFAIGTTMVTCTATDAANNSTNCQFTVEVAPLGTDTAGIYVPSTGSWFLRNANSPGAADLVFGYGPAGLGWIALRGDWDGNGSDTAGLYDPANGNFFLKNTNAAGGADLVYGFGPAGFGWQPLVGDWNGDGVDTIGLYDPSSGFFFLRNSHAPGAADLVYGFGPAGTGWTPMTGDWDGNGTDTVGLYDPATGNFFLRNTHAAGGADLVYGFGPAGIGWTPLAGDWNGDGADTIGLYSPTNGFFFLRNFHAPGAADVVFGYGPANTTPILGDWNGQ